jgi:hypothetical protein
MTLDGTSDRIHDLQTCPSLRLLTAAFGDEELSRARRPLGPEAKHGLNHMAGYKVAILPMPLMKKVVAIWAGPYKGRGLGSRQTQ